MIRRILILMVVTAVSSAARIRAQEGQVAEMAAIISSLSGEASVVLPSDSKRTALRVFDWLPAGSVVEVGANSHMIIAFSNGRRFGMDAGSAATLAGGALQAPTGVVSELKPFPPMPRLAAIDRAVRAGARSGAIRIRGDRALQIANLYPRKDASALPDETTLLFSPVREGARYKVELEDEFGRTIFSAETESSSLAVPNGILKPGARYFWRVRTVEIVGPASRGESEFATLASEEIGKRAAFKAGLREKGDAEALALLAEIDRRLGLLLESRNEFREALSKSPSDQTLRRIIGDIERQLSPEAPAAKP
jgi:hypothetical protein